MEPLAWSALLLVVGLVLVTLEVFVPSGGVLGVLSIASLAAGIILAFYHSGVEAGLLFLAITAVAVAHGAGSGLSLVAENAHGPPAAARTCPPARRFCPIRPNAAPCGNWSASRAWPRR